MIIAKFPDLSLKGAKMPYTSVNGHMFSFLSPEGILSLRLNAHDQTLFIEEKNSKLTEQHGRIMKEYVDVPVEVVQDLKELQHYFSKSLAYVSSLKPKPTSKKKSARKKVPRKK